MSEGWTHIDLADVEPNPEKPGTRMALSPPLGIDEFNLNVAVLGTDERLSENHYHYHENQQELFLVVDGRCCVETGDEGFEMSTDEAVAFDAGEAGAHVIHNPFNEPCRLVAIGWPQDGRYPVHQLSTTAELVDSRDDG